MGTGPSSANAGRSVSGDDSTADGLGLTSLPQKQRYAHENVEPGFEMVDLDFDMAEGPSAKGVHWPGVQVLTRPLHGLCVAARIFSSGAKYTAAAAVCSFYPKAAKVLAVVGLSAWLPLRRSSKLHRSPAMRVVGPMVSPFAVFGCMWLVLPIVQPGLWRTMLYWQRFMPVVTSYVGAGRRANKAKRAGDTQKADEIWQQQHHEAASAIFDVLADIRGFYLKLGQIIATKTDMLPKPYTDSLSRLLDKMPPAPFKCVKRAVERELKRSVDEVFQSIDAFPLASATVAQVHRASLRDGRQVVIKVQHHGTKQMMAADLFNMRLGVMVLEMLHLKLPFDLGSVVREYCEVVPLEFDFELEGSTATLISESLRIHAEHFPLLQHVVVPAVYPSLTTPRLLTMDHVDGVPLLDIAHMDQAVKQELLSALVMAFGVMILRCGLFHTDPHPGNLLALTRPGPDGSPMLQLAILDFGQVKRLTNAARLRVALLVLSLSSREGDLIVSTMRELGMVIENCSPKFEAIAGTILFDTRMDFPEAVQSPLDPDANEGWRTTKVPEIPRDLFMVVRVVTLLRGVMASLGVDVHSSVMWRPLAMQTIAELSGELELENLGVAVQTIRDASGSGTCASTSTNSAQALMRCSAQSPPHASSQHGETAPASPTQAHKAQGQAAAELAGFLRQQEAMRMYDSPKVLSPVRSRHPMYFDQ